MVMINKLKILPPTLREKKRYIAFHLYSQNKVAKDTLIPYLGILLLTYMVKYMQVRLIFGFLILTLLNLKIT